jgi:hypothetical protein
MTFGNFSANDTDIGNDTTLIERLQESALKPNENERSYFEENNPDGNAGDDEADGEPRTLPVMIKIEKRCKDQAPESPGIHVGNTRSDKPKSLLDNLPFAENDSNDGDVEDDGKRSQMKSKRPVRRSGINFGKVGGKHKGHQLLRTLKATQHDDSIQVADPSHNPFDVLSIIE